MCVLRGAVHLVGGDDEDHLPAHRRDGGHHCGHQAPHVDIIYRLLNPCVQLA